MKTLVTAVTLALAAGTASAGVVFSEGFESGLGQFAYQDYRTQSPSAFAWGTNEEAGLGNFTGGMGAAAMSNSDGTMGAYDHAIITPPIPLPQGVISMSFLMNYQNFANLDFADVDVSNDGGASWNNLLRFNDDKGGFFAEPGHAALVDLSAYAGQTVQVRFHHYDNLDDAFDWYWQVDEFSITAAIPSPGAVALLGAAGLIACHRRR